ncbi:MAG TPA: IS4 family transposase [Archangium sp.]|nr:IS4 family transposase [Archangium sp.]
MNAHLGGGGSGESDDQDEFLAPLGGGMNVALNEILERFTQRSPVTVMVRRTLEHALSSKWIDEVFEAQRDKQYTRELLFSSVVDLMGLVALGLRPSLHAAAQSSPDLTVSLAALYDKVNRTEPQVVRALVQGSAERLVPVVRPMKKQEPWAAGYQVRILDGNHLPASEKRLKELRGFRGAALPGQSLVVYAPELGLVVDVLPAEDAHAQERALMGPVLERVREGELWLADRNFSTSGILRAVEEKRAAFIIREHGASPNPSALGERREVGRGKTGRVYEQAVRVEGERPLELRRIEVHLDEPTEDGETVIRLLTNVPAEKMSALEVAELYRKRWKIEGMLGELEAVLESEVRSLGKPRAALLAFGVAVLAYNALSVVKSAEEASHDLEASNEQVSTYYIAAEVKYSYGGMMVMVEPEEWAGQEVQSAEQLSAALLEMAKKVKPATLRKHPRAAKKKVKKGYAPGKAVRKHVATARVLKGQKLS